jgi:hypothetical protein
MGAAGDLGATIDTFLGNMFLSGGTWIAAGTNGIHNKIAHPDQYMKPLDDVVATVTHRLHDAIWSPWGALALLGVAALLLVYSLHGRLSAIVSASAWALLEHPPGGRSDHSCALDPAYLRQPPRGPRCAPQGGDVDPAAQQDRGNHGHLLAGLRGVDP